HNKRNPETRVEGAARASCENRPCGREILPRSTPRTSQSIELVYLSFPLSAMVKISKKRCLPFNGKDFEFELEMGLEPNFYPFSLHFPNPSFFYIFPLFIVEEGGFF
ncbi:hypothetical protein AABB24_010412, partial [Solanum stoloniferum]